MIDQDLVSLAGGAQRKAKRSGRLSLAVTGINLYESFFQHDGIISISAVGIKRQIQAGNSGARLAHAELFTTAVLVGLLIGASLPLLFAAWTMGAVARIANKLVVEVRRQFKETKGILKGMAEPDTDRCVDVIARDSLMATVVAGIIAIASPFIMAFALGVETLGGFLVGAMLVGSVLVMSMPIGGGAWDNAKKWIESHRENRDDMEVAYKAAVVGDMVCDPFKDVSGPAMNILITLMVTIALVFCLALCSV